jgi:hypothetical protein
VRYNDTSTLSVMVLVAIMFMGRQEVFLSSSLMLGWNKYRAAKFPGKSAEANADAELRLQLSVNRARKGQSEAGPCRCRCCHSSSRYLYGPLSRNGTSITAETQLRPCFGVLGGQGSVIGIYMFLSVIAA